MALPISGGSATELSVTNAWRMASVGDGISIAVLDVF